MNNTQSSEWLNSVKELMMLRSDLDDDEVKLFVKTLEDKLQEARIALYDELILGPMQDGFYTLSKQELLNRKERELNAPHQTEGEQSRE